MKLKAPLYESTCNVVQSDPPENMLCAPDLHFAHQDSASTLTAKSPPCLGNYSSPDHLGATLELHWTENYQASPDGRSRPPARRLPLGAHLRRFIRKDALGKDCAPVRCASRLGGKTQWTQTIKTQSGLKDEREAGATEKPPRNHSSSSSAKQRRSQRLNFFQNKSGFKDRMRFTVTPWRTCLL